MQGGAGAGQRGAQRRVQPLLLQPLYGQAQAFGHALGSAAGGCGQRHLRQGQALVLRLCRQQQQQAGDGGGLAGTGATSDQGQRVAQGHAGGACLLVFAGGGLREQAREQRRHGSHVRCRQRMAADALQADRQLPLVLAVTAQVQQAVLQHQRCFLCGGAGVLRRRYPGRGLQLRQPLRRLWPCWHAVDQALWLAWIEACVPLRYGQRGQCGRQRHVVRGVLAQALEAGGQGVVQGAQLATAMQVAQQAHAVSPRARAAISAWAASPPANKASSASTSSGAKRCTCTPLPATSRPRQNRYRIPPMSRA
ncbi:hypothetical protein D3C73_615360 [compost metagenome]